MVNSPLIRPAISLGGWHTLHRYTLRCARDVRQFYIYVQAMQFLDQTPIHPQKHQNHIQWRCFFALSLNLFSESRCIKIGLLYSLHHAECLNLKYPKKCDQCFFLGHFIHHILHPTTPLWRCTTSCRCTWLFLFPQAEEDAGLEVALRYAEAREKEMQKVRSSDLYLEWQRLFSSHLRAGGTLQDFSTEVFLKEVPLGVKIVM